nr:M20/M25/M40 family metallo-hydrolase [Ammoniphilus resinae]
MLQQFLQLVQIDSVTGAERQICDELIGQFQQLGFQVIEDQSAEKTGHAAGNIVATLPGNSSGPMIFFTSHMDTVTPGIGIKPRIEGEYVVSDGSTILGSDDKAGVAAILEGLRVISESKLPHSGIQVLITAGEESGLAGSKALDPGLLKAEYGFALDSSGKVGDIIVSAPFQAKMKVIVHGRAAHAGVNPEDGLNAIQVASRAIMRMPIGRIDQETTANIGKIEGGQATNIVCPRVEFLAEARSLVEEKLEQQLAKMQKAITITAEEFQTAIDVHVEKMYPGYKFSEDDLVTQKAMEAIKAIGRKPQLKSSGGGSDANAISGYGIPTVNLAIGYEEIHTTNERMPVEELYKAAELVVALSQAVLEE